MIQLLLTLWQNKHLIQMLSFAKRHPKKSIMLIIIAWLLSSGYISATALEQALDIISQL